jgi:hypothetical protein
MKVASRFMPPAMNPPLKPVRWLVLAGLVALILYCAWLHPAVVGSFLAATVVVSIWWNRATRRSLQRLAESRQDETICEFVRCFDARNTDTWILRAVYEELQAYLAPSYPAFPLRAEDDLCRDLKIDQQHLDFDIARRVLERTGRSLDGAQLNPLYGKVRTVRDFVNFVADQPWRGTT